MLKWILIAITMIIIVLIFTQAEAHVYIDKRVNVNHNEAKRMVNPARAPSMNLVTNRRWPCGGFAGIGAQGQYAGVNLGGTKDSKNCIAWMLASQTTDADKKEAYLCQIKVHRKAMKLNGTPCTKRREAR